MFVKVDADVKHSSCRLYISPGSVFLAEGLFFTVAWGKRSAALGIEISKDVWPKAKIT